MAKAPPWYKWFPADFLGATVSWTDAEVGMYKRLLDADWMQGGLPEDPADLRPYVKSAKRAFLQAWHSKLAAKFPLLDTPPGEVARRANPRLEEERQKYHTYVEGQRDKGKLGAEKRWGEPMAGAIATAMPVPCPEDGKSEVRSQKSEENKPSAPKEKKPSKKKETNPDIKTFIDRWFDKFKEKFGKPYVVAGGKDGDIIKRLLGAHSLETLWQHAETFFDTPDEFTQKAGYTIGVFSSQINKIAGGQYGTNRKASQATSVRRGFRNAGRSDNDGPEA